MAQRTIGRMQRGGNKSGRPQGVPPLRWQIGGLSLRFVCRYGRPNGLSVSLRFCFPVTQRNRIVLVFDEHYTRNGNAVFAAARHLIGQMEPGTEFQLFCRGRYRGPRLSSRSAKITIADPKLPPTGMLDFARRILSRLKLANSPKRSICNIERTDHRLVRWLFQADRIHAVIVFTLDPDYALQIARLTRSEERRVG